MNIEQNTTAINTKSRSPWIAFFTSLFFPGLGQFYNGQALKGISFLMLILFIPLLFGLLRVPLHFEGLVVSLSVITALSVYIIADAIIYARKQKIYELKPYNRWYFYLIFAAVKIGVYAFQTPMEFMQIQAFKIPGQSNLPVIETYDQVVADIRAYQKKDPEYGDFILFKRPNDIFYTFRLIGKPGDKVSISNNIVSINNTPCKYTFIKDTIYEGIPVKEYEEELPNGYKHRTYRYDLQIAEQFRTFHFEVPENKYLVLGDNRDNAADSRYEGLVSSDSILGQIIYCYGLKRDRINIDFRGK